MNKLVSTHSCLRFMLIFAQCFGMLPVSGITKDVTSLKFRWSSKRTIYSIIFAFSALVNTIFQVIMMSKLPDVAFKEIVTLLFYFVTFVTVVIFIDMARKWPALMEKWAQVDEAMANYGYPFKLGAKLKTIMFIIISAAMVEHTLFISDQFPSIKKGDNLIETLDNFLQFRFGYIFVTIKYNIWCGIYAQILNIFSTISWNFMDVFIMLISLCLSTRFSQVAKNVSAMAKKMETDENIWRKLREDYTRLTILSGTVDDAISNIILVSFGNNVFVILVQLFNTLERPPTFGLLDKIYYFYSFAFLIIRIVAVALYAATIDSESRKPVFYLTTLSHQVYNIEVERFLFQTKYSSAALTGHKLLTVKKSLILSLAGAIVSYELILIQFQTV